MSIDHDRMDWELEKIMYHRCYLAPLSKNTTYDTWAVNAAPKPHEYVFKCIFTITCSEQTLYRLVQKREKHS